MERNYEVVFCPQCGGVYHPGDPLITRERLCINCAQPLIMYPDYQAKPGLVLTGAAIPDVQSIDGKLIAAILNIITAQAMPAAIEILIRPEGRMILIRGQVELLGWLNGELQRVSDNYTLLLLPEDPIDHILGHTHRGCRYQYEIAFRQDQHISPKCVQTLKVADTDYLQKQENIYLQMFLHPGLGVNPDIIDVGTLDDDLSPEPGSLHQLYYKMVHRLTRLLVSIGQMTSHMYNRWSPMATAYSRPIASVARLMVTAKSPVRALQLRDQLLRKLNRYGERMDGMYISREDRRYPTDWWLGRYDLPRTGADCTYITDTELNAILVKLLHSKG